MGSGTTSRSRKRRFIEACLLFTPAVAASTVLTSTAAGCRLHADAMLNAAQSPMPMWEISVETVVAARHRIRGVPGEGGRVHEHHWRVRVTVRAAELDGTGWVLDFREVEAALLAVVAPYDAAFLNEVPPFDDMNPTRENVARVLAEGLARKLDNGRARVHRVDVSEGGHCASHVRD